MAETATYHSPDGTARLLTILAKNADGTVELGTPKTAPDGKDTLDIGKCPISRDGKVGTCTLTIPAPLTKEEKAAEDKAAQDAKDAAAAAKKAK
jgi:hypothetical protein